MQNYSETNQAVTSSTIPGTNIVSSPLDFIRQELKPEHAVGTVAEKVLSNASSQVLPDPMPSRMDEKIETTSNSQSEQDENRIPPSLDTLADLLLNEKKEAAPVEAPQETDGEDIQEIDEVEALVQKGPKESIRDLRNKSKELKKLLEEKESTLSELEIEVNKYRSGEDLPEELKSGYEQRIKQLEQFERLHALKLSRAWQEKISVPAKALKEEANVLAKDYNVDVRVFEKALEIEGKRELNSYLRGHFDDVGTLEARDIVLQMKDLRAEAKAAEAEPAETLRRIEEESRVLETQRAEVRVNNIINNAKSGWQKSLHELTSTGEYPELTINPNEEEHNKVVRPILEASAKNYGQFMTWLGKSIRDDVEIPKETASWLAKNLQLATTASVMSASRASHFNRAEELLGETKKLNSLSRPPLGASGDGGAAYTPKAPNSPEEAADVLIRQVQRR